MQCRGSIWPMMRQANRHPRLLAAAALLVAGCASVFIWPTVALADNETLETAIKAAYLTKLGDFVEWPPGAMQASAFNLCFLGPPTFGDLLGKAAQNRTVQAHPIALLHLSTIDGSPNCQILFVANSVQSEIAQVLGTTRGSPVLTVTDRQSDPSSRGIINFVIRGGRVRFEINRKAAAVNHLAISSKLLDLAVNVQE